MTTWYNELSGWGGEGPRVRDLMLMDVIALFSVTPETPPTPQYFCLRFAAILLFTGNDDIIFDLGIISNCINLAQYSTVQYSRVEYSAV